MEVPVLVELGTPMVDLLGKLTGEREFTLEVERLVTAFGAPADRSDAPERPPQADLPQARRPRQAAGGRAGGGEWHLRSPTCGLTGLPSPIPLVSALFLPRFEACAQ